MQYLVRLVQMHAWFRRPELLALAELQGLTVQIRDYRDDVSYTALDFIKTMEIESHVSGINLYLSPTFLNPI